MKTTITCDYASGPLVVLDVVFFLGGSWHLESNGLKVKPRFQHECLAKGHAKSGLSAVRGALRHTNALYSTNYEPDLLEGGDQ